MTLRMRVNGTPVLYTDLTRDGLIAILQSNASSYKSFRWQTYVVKVT